MSVAAGKAGKKPPPGNVSQRSCDARGVRQDSAALRNSWAALLFLRIRSGPTRTEITRRRFATTAKPRRSCLSPARSRLAVSSRPFPLPHRAKRSHRFAARRSPRHAGRRASKQAPNLERAERTPTCRGFGRACLSRPRAQPRESGLAASCADRRRVAEREGTATHGVAASVPGRALASRSCAPLTPEISEEPKNGDCPRFCLARRIRQ